MHGSRGEHERVGKLHAFVCSYACACGSLLGGVGVLVAALLLVGAVGAHAGEEQVRMQKQVGQVSLPFIANQGQAAKEVAFYAPSLGGGTVVVTTEGKLVYELPTG